MAPQVDRNHPVTAAQKRELGGEAGVVRGEVVDEQNWRRSAASIFVGKRHTLST
jgi:hypothetical protein